MQIEWTEESAVDLLRHREFGDQSNWNTVGDFADLIIEFANQLLLFPNSGRPGDEPGTRELERFS